MSSKRPPPPLPEPLSPLVDAHTHLDACGAVDADDVRAILDRAGAVGVQAVVTIADDLAAARWAAQAAHWDPRVYAAVALHPTRANALDDEARDTLERLATDPRVVAVGETGIDRYWPGRLEGCATPDRQRDAFAKSALQQISCRNLLTLPVDGATTTSWTFCGPRAPRKS